MLDVMNIYLNEHLNQEAHDYMIKSGVSSLEEELEKKQEKLAELEEEANELDDAISDLQYDIENIQNQIDCYYEAIGEIF